MPQSGVRANELPTMDAADDVIANKDGSTGRISVGSLGAQLVAGAAFQGALSAIEGQLTAGLLLEATWAGLQALDPGIDGAGGEVLDSDAGSHGQATAGGYNGGAVDNAGRYSWSLAWTRWVRIGDTGLSGRALQADLDTVAAATAGKADQPDLDALALAVKLQVPDSDLVSDTIASMRITGDGNTLGTQINKNTVSVPGGSENFVHMGLDVGADELTPANNILIRVECTGVPRSLSANAARISDTFGVGAQQVLNLTGEDGVYVGVLMPDVAGVMADRIRIRVDARDGVVVAKILIFRGVFQPTQINVPRSTSREISEAIENRPETEAIRTMIDAAVNASIMRAFGGELGAGQIGDRLIDFGLATVFVDAELGDDANAGTAAAPMQTLNLAAAGLGPGDTIALRAGQYHMIEGDIFGSSAAASPTITAYGAGTYPVLDARQQIGGLVWTSLGANAWVTNVTFRDPSPFNDGTIDKTSRHYRLFVDDEALVWQTGGSSITLNNAIVNAVAGSWGLNIVGQSDPDPRLGADNGVDHRVVIHMPDGSDPNGRNIKISDRQVIAQIFGAAIKRFSVVGGLTKDGFRATSTDAGTMALIDGYRHIGFAANGHAGLCNLSGHIEVEGRGIEDHALEAVDQAAGSALNLYTDDDHTTRTLTVDTNCVIDMRGALRGIYGASKTTAGIYGGIKNFVMRQGSCVFASNLGTVYRFDNGFDDNGETPFIRDKCVTRDTFAKDVANFINSRVPDWTHIGGEVDFRSDLEPFGSMAILADIGGGTALTIENLEFRFTGDHDALGGHCNILASRSGIADVTLILKNCHDRTVVTPEVRAGCLHRLTTDGIRASEMFLELTGGTTLGDLMDTYHGTNYPAGLIAGGGTTFGMGDRTGPEIEAALTAAGVPHTISGQTTIVSRDGVTLSYPGWK